METQKSSEAAKASASNAGASTDIFETLAEALTHTDAMVRQNAAKEFGKRKDKRAIGPLAEMLTDEDTKVRWEAATALNELGWRPASEKDQARHAVALQRFQIAITIGEASIDSLLLLLNDTTASFRMAALETLAKIGGNRVVGAFIEVLKDENPHVRAVAVQALSRIGNPSAVETIAKMVRDQSWEVRSIVLDALGTFKIPAAVDAAIRILKDESPDLRQRACEVLADMGDRRAISALIVALVDEEINVRTGAILALQHLDSAWENSEFTKGAAQDLLTALKHKDSSVRETAADTLRRIGQTKAMNSLLSSETTSVPPGAMKSLLSALKASNRDLRQAAAEALGRSGETAAIPSLVETLRDEDEWVREAALYALNLLNWQPANDAELVLKAVILQRWETAVLFDTVAMEPLLMMLNSYNPEIIRGAIETLGKINNPQAIEPLQIMLQHPAKVVRTAAAGTLVGLGWQTSDPTQCVSQAITLHDWQGAVQYGCIALQPLVAAIKENQKDRTLCDAAAAALATLCDPAATQMLLGLTRDGQIAGSVIQALFNVIEHNCSDLQEADLRGIAALSNVVQFQYAFDARYGTHVRSGMISVDTSHLKKLARQELVRRGLEH